MSLPNESRDRIYLNVLACCYFLFAFVSSLFLFFPLFDFLCGLIIKNRPYYLADYWSMPFVLYNAKLRMLGSAGVFALGVLFAGCFILTVIFLLKRINRGFCIGVSWLVCLLFPFGTLLGIFSLVVLSLNSVKELFKS